MKISALLFAFIWITVITLKAQDKPSALVKGESASVDDNLIKAETFFPNIIGVSYEKKLGQHISLYNMVGLMGYYGGGTFAQAKYGANPYYVLTPQITVQPRFYHNLSKRAASDKNTKYNSANYIGFSARVYHEGLFITNAENIPKGSAIFDLILSYGLQRNFLKRLNFDMAIQPGIQFTFEGAEAFLGVNLQLGFIVFSN